jgi:beta-lactamase superfamily II metal-dependent hydrolase
MFRLASLAVAAALLAVAPARAADPIAAPIADEAPLYLDEQGEEVFGPGYLPTSPPDIGARQRAGQPAAGFRLSARAQRWLDALRPAAALAELRERFPDAAAGLSRWRARLPAARALAVPLRRSVRELLLPIRPAAAAARSAPPPAGPVREMTAHFVDVGQGAGAILEFPCGVAVIDTGGEYNSGVDGAKRFTDYLDAFFVARPRLNRTIDVLITSHPHKDHLYGLSRMFGDDAPRYRVRNIVDNGQTHAKGSVGVQTRARAAAVRAGAGYNAVELKSQVSATGTTNKVIDPLACRGVDPVITAFWGGRNDALHGRSARRYSTPNNHSVVVRVDYGRASFLFLGDLQREGAADMFEEYADNLGVFDVDVLHASHHGADNGTTDELLKILTPKLAVISMGARGDSGSATAWGHGHPRASVLRAMQEAPHVVSGMRAPATFWAADAEETPFSPVTVDRAIYATGWEGTVLLKARSDGSYRLTG